MEFFAERLVKLKEVLPGLAVTSDVIVGFPGETEEEFMETYQFRKRSSILRTSCIPVFETNRYPCS